MLSVELRDEGAVQDLAGRNPGPLLRTIPLPIYEVVDTPPPPSGPEKAPHRVDGIPINKTRSGRPPGLSGVQMLEYSLNLQNVSFSAVRTVRVLRPLRAINRVPSMRILVTLLLDTLPMLGNVLLLCFFVFFIFGIVGVQLWAGLLRNRCFLPENLSSSSWGVNLERELHNYYHTENDDESPFICSQPKENGMRLCSNIPILHEEGLQCTLDGSAYNDTDNTTCVNWNQYYTNCTAGKVNPFKGAINFDNIGYAWIAIFQVITLEGWVDIMYFVMDSHSFYNFIYFILLIIVGSFFMINLCLVVIATQFSETKQRESQLMKEQRVRFMSNASTLASFSEPGSCYDELLKYLVHVVRKTGRQLCHLVRVAARQAGLSVCASPVLEQTSQKRRRQKQLQKRGSIHHLMHYHHHHYHLGNGSVLHGSSTNRDPETGSSIRRSRIGSLMLPDTSTSVSITAVGGPELSLHCTPSTSMALQVYKRNSVPFVGPAHKNYPTLQSSFLLEQQRQRSLCENSAGEGGSRTDSIFTNLNIPPPSKNTSQGPADPPVATDVLRRSSTINCSSSNLDTTQAFDPKSCPYCMKANDSEGTEGNETADSDSEGVYEFTQDAHYRDRRDPNKKSRISLGARTAKVIHFWRLVCDTFRKIVDSKYFGRGIMIAILINTLSMGIEYHEQPDELTNALEISNIVFTSLFALEMLLKVLVYGPFGYIKNPYNIFDGIIVVISVWEIVGQQGGGLSVLRTFRLMRVLKLVRFMPALQRQLVVLMKTMDNVATFCMLLMLFIFIFSILGMHLFGCKFGSERDGDTLPDRKNFDSLLWAIVTVFQILTQEDWNKVLYNGMASTSSWAALYFIALMTFGNYVLFNLLVAILVEGFQTEGDASNSNSEMDLYSRSMEDVNSSKRDMAASTVVPINGHVDLKTSLTPPLITHTAATPMPIPKISGGGDAAFESHRGSNIPMDPSFYNKSPSSVRSSPPHAPLSSASSWNSRRSSWNSLGRAPSLKRQKRQSGERRSLLSADGQSSSEEEEVSGADAGGGGERMSECDEASLSGTDSFGQRPQHRRMESVETRSSLDLPPDTLQVPYIYRSASIHSARPPHPQHTAAQDCNGKSSPSATTNQLSVDEHHSEDENVEEEGNMSRRLRLMHWFSQRQPEWCRQRSSWSLYLFPPESRFRVTCNKIIAHKMFDHVVLVIIFLNCITIAMERPRIDPSSAAIFHSSPSRILTRWRGVPRWSWTPGDRACVKLLVERVVEDWGRITGPFAEASSSTAPASLSRLLAMRPRDRSNIHICPKRLTRLTPCRIPVSSHSSMLNPACWSCRKG
ncbi:hypothetical protein ACEWY4_025632 [Coilia grayii]|uniref:Ion transport domain-containing protein n=1 Tax=Coilia grayii TaxID=363190 RepID=A0ABD1ISH3_9TELE